MAANSAHIYLDTKRRIGTISPLLFGGFAEHMGRCIYQGIYDPDSAHADENGLRRDVLDALREQGYTIIRYPGGNFLSGYNWLDGVGPKEQRPRRRELAWQSIETNQFGTNEFMHFCRALGALPMLGVNLGTGTIQEAANLLEYCNAPTGTKYADLRAEHGYPEPHNVRYWCLGNEMDGPWQMGHLDAEAYAVKALEAAKLMRYQDPSLRLVAAGSSNTEMPTYPEWDRTVLEICWEHIDYLSLHYYAGNWDGDSDSYLALASHFENHIDTLAGTARFVKAKRRSRHNVYLSLDEWQVWYKDRSGKGGWNVAPHLSEEIYNLEDALVVAQWLNVFLRRCNILRIACVAQIVNVISWLHTRGDDLLKQPSFYPFMLVSNLARGVALDLNVLAPEVETRRFGPVPALDVSASYNPDTGASAAFLVNRSRDPITAELLWQGEAPAGVREAWLLTGNNLKAVNTWQNPNAITAQPMQAPAIREGKLALELPPFSFTALAFGA